jgi:tRNA pseudouridine13 synthase
MDERRRLAVGAGVAELPHAYGPPQVRGLIRLESRDFCVSEKLSFDLEGEGEHLYLLVRKTGQNTRWVAKRLAERLDIPYVSVGYAGLKDRHAIAEQWFSLHLAGRADPAPASFGIDGVEVQAARRHRTKLRIGSVRANRFSITVRGLEGPIESIDRRIRLAKLGGVPNYFGAQRFGRNARNLDLLVAETSSGPRVSREARSFALSAVRSALFNAFLADRVRGESWRRCQPGEIAYDADARRFMSETSRPGDTDGQPTGLLWGCGANQSTGTALELERRFFAGFPDSTRMLEARGLRMARRSLVLTAADLHQQRFGNRLELGFTLGRGSYATSLLREIIVCVDACSPA